MEIMRKEGMFLNPTALRFYVRLPPAWEKAILSRSAPSQQRQCGKIVDRPLVQQGEYGGAREGLRVRDLRGVYPPLQDEQNQVRRGDLAQRKRLQAAR